MVGALLLAPVFAVQVQKFLEGLREKRNRRMQIFQTLMASRAVRLSFEHVRSLNMIDLEFSARRTFGINRQSKKDAGVIDAWKMHRRHLQQDVSDEDSKAWANEKENRFRDLLFAMSTALGYEFDKAELESGAYNPDANFYQDLSARSIIRNLDGVLMGKRAINVVAWEGKRPPQSSEQAAPDGVGAGGDAPSGAGEDKTAIPIVEGDNSPSLEG